VVFFPSLKKPEPYVLWSLKGQEASSVIEDFRIITAEIERCDELTDLIDQIKLDTQRREGIKSAAARRGKSKLDRKLQRLEAAAGIHDEYTYVELEYWATPELERKIESAKSDLINALHNLHEQQQRPLGRISKKLQELLLKPYDNDLESFIRRYVHHEQSICEKFEKYLSLVQSQEEFKTEIMLPTPRAAQVESIKRELARIDNSRESSLHVVDTRLADIVPRKEELALTLLDMISSLGSDRTIYKTPMGSSRSAPLFNLGLTATKVDETMTREVPILFLAADPIDATRLRLGEELREIQEKLQLGKFREQFKLHQRMSVRSADISQALLDVRPQVVHFSGHGTAAGALCFENQIGETHPIQPDALAALFEQFSKQVHCVVLNACYTEVQANAIARHIDYVIGMSQAIEDKGAIAFTIGFYQALGAGCGVEEAYKLGCVQIRLQNIPEHLTPILVKRNQA
jgi:hypothetical protein